MRYSFKIEISDISEFPFTTLEVMTGEVEAERYSHACIAAWPLVTARCDQYRASGHKVGVGDLLAERSIQVQDIFEAEMPERTL